MREVNIERRLVSKIHKAGGMCLKFTSPGNRGVPDRLILLNQHIIFAELKAPGKKPNDLQVYMIEKMKLNGARVVVIDSAESVDQLMELLR